VTNDYDLAVKILGAVDSAVADLRTDEVLIGGTGVVAHVEFAGVVTFEFRLDDRKRPKLIKDSPFFDVGYCEAEAIIIARAARKAFKESVLLAERIAKSHELS